MSFAQWCWCSILNQHKMTWMVCVSYCNLSLVVLALWFSNGAVKVAISQCLPYLQGFHTIVCHPACVKTTDVVCIIAEQSRYAHVGMVKFCDSAIWG